MTYALIAALVTLVLVLLRNQGLKAEAVEAKAEAARSEAERDSFALKLAKSDELVSVMRRQDAVVRTELADAYRLLSKTGAPGARARYDELRADALRREARDGANGLPAAAAPEPGAAAGDGLPPR